MSRPWVWMMLSRRSVEQLVDAPRTVANHEVAYPVVAQAPFHTRLGARASCALYIHTVDRCVRTSHSLAGPDRT